MLTNDRSTIARIAAHTRWANETDRTAATANARAAAFDRFMKQVDPENKLPHAERVKRAQNARKAYFMQLARKSVAARQGRK